LARLLTPVSLWKNFSDLLELSPSTIKEEVENGVKFEYLYFYGASTGAGRTLIYGVVASRDGEPSGESVLILRDKGEVLDKNLLIYFVNKGYNAMFVDYSGKRDGVEQYTKYPNNVSYANLEECKNYSSAPYGANKTCWYEWVAVGIYARRLLAQKFSSEKIGLIGIKDGGEIAWKLAAVENFSCAVVVNACGWLSYSGIGKFGAAESDTDLGDEAYNFIAGVDSQSYAPYVKCPMLLLCATGEPYFNYDRAFDTFARINPQFSAHSCIAYSINCGKRIDLGGCTDMFMFLDCFVKERTVFIPRPAEITVKTDSDSNLIACVNCDSAGIVERCTVYYSEDCFDFATREWSSAPPKNVITPYEREFYLNTFDKSTTLFLFCTAVYSNGFTVCSKLAIKKLTGKFRNGQAKSKIMYTNTFGCDCFSAADNSSHAVGDIFLTDSEAMPALVTMQELSGVASLCGLKTTRIKSPQFLPDRESIFKLDICAESDALLSIEMKRAEDSEIFSANFKVVGGVWQSLLIPSKNLKNKNGISLPTYLGCESLTLTCDLKFAINNIMWL